MTQVGTQQLPVKYPVAFAAGDDFTLTLTVTESGAPYVWGTVTAAIVGHATVTAFTVSLPADGTCVLSLTDAQTTALGPGGYAWNFTATKAGYAQTWMSGTLTVTPPGSPGVSQVSATVTVTTGAATSLTVTSSVYDATARTSIADHLADTTDAHDASAVSVADTGGYYTGTNVETVLAELPAKFGPIARNMGAVCFVFDDGYTSWTDSIIPALNTGQRVTFFVQTNKIGTTISAANVTEWHAAGHEIASHSTAHQNYTTLTATQRAADHDAAVAALEALTTAGAVTSFAYPSGARNATTDIECLHRYKRIFTIGVPSPLVQRSAPPGQFIYGRQSWAPTATNHAKVLDLIRLAASQPVLVVIYGHDPGNSSGAFSTDPSATEVAEAFDLCASLGVPMLTLAEALPSSPAALVNGGFENGLSGWLVTNSGAYTVESITDAPLAGLPGTKSLHILATGATTCFVEQIIPVDPSRPFNLSYRYRTVSGAGHYHVVKEYGADGTVGTQTNSGAFGAANTTWTLGNRDVTLAATCVAVGIIFGSTAATEVYIDHVHTGYQAWGKFG